jgi:hypothetical protein
MSFMQKWNFLMKAIEKTKAELVATMLKQVENFKPLASHHLMSVSYNSHDLS